MIIYKATNLHDYNVYIGMTTKPILKRIKTHIRDSKTKDTEFYRAMNEYGFDSFNWDILDTAETMQELEDKERAYIKHYGSFDNLDAGYNSQSGGRSNYDITQKEKQYRSERVSGSKNPMYGVPSPNTGVSFSDEHKKRISNALKGAYRPHVLGSNNPAARSVINLDTGEIFGTLKDAAIAYNTSRSNIGAVCGGRTKTAAGCKWAYND